MQVENNMARMRNNPEGAANLENLTAMITKLQKKRLQDQQKEMHIMWKQGQDGEAGRGGAPPPLPPPPIPN